MVGKTKEEYSFTHVIKYLQSANTKYIGTNIKALRTLVHHLSHSDWEEIEQIQQGDFLFRTVKIMLQFRWLCLVF